MSRQFVPSSDRISASDRVSARPISSIGSWTVWSGCSSRWGSMPWAGRNGATWSGSSRRMPGSPHPGSGSRWGADTDLLLEVSGPPTRDGRCGATRPVGGGCRGYEDDVCDRDAGHTGEHADGAHRWSSADGPLVSSRLKLRFQYGHMWVPVMFRHERHGMASYEVEADGDGDLAVVLTRYIVENTAR